MTQGWQQVRFVVAVLVVLGAGASVAVDTSRGADAPAAGAASANQAGVLTPGNEADEKSIRAAADGFVKAFNAGDAKAIGALWAADCEYTDESGESFHGRAEIEKVYADLFKEHRGATMTVTIESIRFLGADIALEKGVANVKAAKEETASASRYTVVHVKRDGKWLMAVGHDAPYVEVANGEYLKQLEWLVGEWAPDAKDKPLRLRFEWMAQKNFIKNTFNIVTDGEESLTGGQIIGWDPKLGSIVSWHFDAQGGFGHDVWTQDGAKWVIEATGIFRDGSESTAVNILTPIDANRFSWQSVNRKLEGVSLPDSERVTIVRIQSDK